MLSSMIEKRYWNLILGLNETIGELAMASSVTWYGYALSKEDGHALRRALDF